MGLLVNMSLPLTLISATRTSSGKSTVTAPVDSTLYFTMPLNAFCAVEAPTVSSTAAAKIMIFFIF